MTHAVAVGMVAGYLFAARLTVARRTYRDARATTKAARSLWRQVPRDFWHVVRVGALIAALTVVAVLGYRAGR